MNKLRYDDYSTSTTHYDSRLNVQMNVFIYMNYMLQLILLYFIVYSGHLDGSTEIYWRNTQ